MNKGLILLDGGNTIVDAQVWVDGGYSALGDDIMESDGATLQQVFFADGIPMDPVPPGAVPDVVIPDMDRLFVADDVRMFEAIDNRIFEA